MITWGVTTVCVGVFLAVGPPVRLLPLAILLGAAIFGVRGYSVTEGRLLVHRLGWATRLDLDRLSEVRHEPEVMLGSLRTFGNGGLFGFSGRFRNQVLGSYRAYATDPRRSVVLEFDSGPIVVTPDDPVDFVDSVRREAGLEAVGT